MVLKRQRVVLCLDRNCAPFWSMHPPKRAICTPLGFLSKYTPKYKQIRGIPIRVSLLFVSPSGQEGTRRVQCNSPVDCCRRGLDRAEPLSAPLGSRCKRVLLRFPVCALPTAGLRCTQAAATRSGRCICPRQRSLRSPFR